MSHEAIFVLSTGRCGTQWLDEAMRAVYGDVLSVTHEPLSTAYLPRRFFRAPTACLSGIGAIPEVAAHIDFIRQTLRSRPYLETGWPCYAALPWLYEALDGRIRIVHLTRHPVMTSFSMATHDVYGRDDWIREGALTPFDPGCLRLAQQPNWGRLSSYEKCLFWWTQLHSYAIELHQTRPDIPWLTIKFENLFSCDDTLAAFVDFCGLTERAALYDQRSCRTDKFQERALPDNWRKIMQYDETIKVAEALGYAPDNIDAHSISQRYFMRKKLRHYLRQWGLLPSSHAS
jgi:hypothetical protein